MTESIHEARDLPAAGRPPFLGHLPLLHDPDSRGDLYLNPLLAECIRMVRTALLQRMDGRQGGAILITSAAAGEGKSTVAWLLARSLAQCGRHVLLVDADLRKAGLADRAKGRPGPGLVEALLAESADGNVIASTGTPHLSLVPAGNVSRADLETLANGRFAAQLEKWSRQFNVILLDSPPVLPVADARILAHQADGTILIVREATSRRDDVLDAVTCLRAAGARVIGTVFIGSSGRGSYESSYYSYRGLRPRQGAGA